MLRNQQLKSEHSTASMKESNKTSKYFFPSIVLGVISIDGSQLDKMNSINDIYRYVFLLVFYALEEVETRDKIYSVIRKKIGIGSEKLTILIDKSKEEVLISNNELKNVMLFLDPSHSNKLFLILKSLANNFSIITFEVKIDKTTGIYDLTTKLEESYSSKQLERWVSSTT